MTSDKSQSTLPMSAGLSVNGADPIGAEEKPQMLLPRKGRAHLTRILDVLARIRSIPTIPFVQLLQRETPHLSWGTTVILITGSVDDALFALLRGHFDEGEILELGAALTVASGWQRFIEAFGIRPDAWRESTPLPWER